MKFVLLPGGAARINLLCCLLAGLFSFLSTSAIAHQGTPPSSLGTTALSLAAVQQLVLPATDPQAQLQADALRTAPGPLRYAVGRTVDVTPATHGTWEQLPNGRIWRLRILSPGATDLNLGFTTYWLPEGANLYLVSEETNRVQALSAPYYQGPYTSEHNAEHGQLWTAVVPGEAAVLELFVPAGAVQEPTLVLGQVGTGYRDLFRLKGPSVPKGDTCEIDVVCAVAAPWTNEARSVALISVGGVAVCSGTLVMDAAGDFRPFLLTANHCEITAGNSASIVAYWNYQSATCGQNGTGVPPPWLWTQNTSGSSFRASKADVDFCLIELTSTPNSSYGVYYSGWDRGGAAPASAVGIHHPSTDGKCISFSAGPLTTTENCITASGVSPDTHWRVPWGTQGVTEGGSSGSGVWDAFTHKLVGTLSGGPSYCGAPSADLWDCYGKFSRAWDSGNSTVDRLRDWLDPCNTGVTAVEGAYPVARPALVSVSATLIAEGCVPTNGVVDPGETVTVSLAVQNVGSLPAASVLGTLQTGGGVLAPNGPQSYGTLAAGGAPVSRSFTFTADGNCGAAITPTLQLQDNARNYCASYSFVMGKLAVAMRENFDTTDVYTLPAGWTESSGLTWYATSWTNDSPPNAVYSYAPSGLSDRQLISPVLQVTSPNAQLSFRHHYAVEFVNDGCVLEISIAGAPFIDIEAAGGAFLAGGYDTMLGSWDNAIRGRPGWTGSSGGFKTTTVNLPAGAAGQNVQLRWRLSTNSSIDGEGWYVDTISLASGFDCCGGGALPPTLGAPRYDGQFQITVTGTTGTRYAIEGSTDLLNWAPLQTNAAPFTYIEANPALFTNRFYRAVLRP